MLGLFKHRPPRPIDSFVEADERVIWVDRSNPARPRRIKLARSTVIHLDGHWFLLSVTLVMVGFLFVVLEGDSMLGLLGVGLAVVGASLTVWSWRHIAARLRRGDPFECDYLLTNRRVLAKSPLQGEVYDVQLKEVEAVTLDNDTLVLQLHSQQAGFKINRDDRAELNSLADPSGALAAFTAALNAFQADAVEKT